MRYIACDGEIFRPLLSTEAGIIQECQACHLGVLEPNAAASQSALYDESFYERGRLSPLLEMIVRVPMRFKVRRLRTLVARGRVLDVGCGNGDFLALFRRSAYERYGVETAAAGYHLARRHGFEGLFHGALESARFPEASFDLVIMNHVLEHVAAPGPVLQEIHRLLKPGGLYVTTQPNIDSDDFLLAREQFFHLDLPRHLYHFTPSSLTRLLERYDLHVRRLVYPALEFTQVPLYSVLARLFSPASFYNRNRRYVFLVFWPLACLAALLSAWRGRTSTIQAICERSD